MLLFGLALWIIVINFRLNLAFQNKQRALNVLISFFLSIALLSYSFTLSLFSGLNFMLFQALFTVTPLLLIIYKIKLVRDSLNFTSEIKNRELILLLTSILCFTVLFFLTTKRWGNWDAWAIWSLHAKYMTFDANFVLLFSEKIDWSHPDYPLMLPSIIGSIWKSLSTDSAMIPALISYVVSLTFLLTIVSSLRQLNLNTLSIIALLIFCFSNILIPFGSTQYADTLLSLFILLPIVLLNHLNYDNHNLYLFLIGFFVASCSWIKNEGIVYFIIFSVLFLIHNLRKKKYIIYYAFGVSVPLIFLIFFKLKYAPSSDLIADSSSNTLTQLFDLKRYVFIIKYIFKTIVSSYSLIIVLLGLVMIFNRNYLKSFAFQIITCLFISYFMVYILTPNNLEWHLNTSFTRLLHHIFPVLIYTTLISFGKMKKPFNVFN